MIYIQKRYRIFKKDSIPFLNINDKSQQFLSFLLYTMNVNLFRFYLGFIKVVGYRKN